MYWHKILLVLVVSLVIPGVSIAQQDELAVNHVVINSQLHTAGQPPRDRLIDLADHGFEMVINLAPPTSLGSIGTEGQLVTEKGITYVNIPVDWLNPNYADFALFSGIMNESDERQVLVHCQVNKRASIFTFLYRVIHKKVPIDEAFVAMEKVWVPRRIVENQWVRFGKMVLERHNIDSVIFD